ncbi:MAG: proteasome assembly chaperone family protein [Candidatus Marsarchaeota archaeon]|nr:proteasome assembly chaperone family protein [Candidatus Marsarchaeota archaeon]
MEKTRIRVRKHAKLKAPIMIVGLPGIGSVGKMVAEHLIKELKAERIATLYSPHFPYQVIMLRHGGIRLMSNRFYVIRRSGRKEDIVILTGDTQAITPEGQYEVNHEIVRFFKEKLGGKFIYTLGGYSAPGSNPSNPKVYANATSAAVVAGLKDSGLVFGESRGTILGSAGMILGFAKMEHVDGICLMGESSFLDVDPYAAKAVLVFLSNRLGLNIDTKNLDKMIQKTAEALKELERQAPAEFPMPGKGDDKPPSYIR